LFDAKGFSLTELFAMSKPNSNSKSKSKYRPEIDGLRALAVLAVVLYHLGLGLPGGFIGVDVFFVISGFLITGILRREMENGTFSLAEFWERRVRRIFPAIFVVVIATLVAGYRFLLPNELVSLGESSVAQALLVANIYFWRDAGYFTGSAELKPLLHTWSLAVEEQFYLLFPFFMLFFRNYSRKRLFWLMAILASVSFCISVYGTKHHPEATFYLLPTRAWELLLGCMLAVIPWKFEASHRRDDTIAVTGFLAIILPIFFYDSRTSFPGVAAVPPVLGTAAIIFATASSPSVWLRKALSCRPLVFIGLISYSLYLWHWPVIVFTRIYFGQLEWQHLLFAGALSFTLAVFSWRLVETPLRGTNYLKQRWQLFPVAASLSCAAIAVSILFVSTKGLPERFPNYSLDYEADEIWGERTASSPTYQVNKTSKQLPNDISLIQSDVTWLGEEFESQVPYQQGLQAADFITLGLEQSQASDRLDFFVWGDSHAMALSHSLHDAATEFSLTGKSYIRRSFCPLPYIHRRNQPAARIQVREDIMEFIDASRPRNLILVCRWAGYAGFEQPSDRPLYKAPYDLYDTRTQNENNEEIIKQNLHELLDFCSERDIQMWIVKQVPETAESLPASQNLRFTLGIAHSRSNQRRAREEYDQQQATANKIFRTLDSPRVHFVDASPLLYDSNGMTINYRAGRSLYRDRDHLTRWGAEQIRPALAQMFREICAANRVEVSRLPAN